MFVFFSSEQIKLRDECSPLLKMKVNSADFKVKNKWLPATILYELHVLTDY